MVHIITCSVFVLTVTSGIYRVAHVHVTEGERSLMRKQPDIILYRKCFSENPNLTKLVLSGKKTPWNDVLDLMLPSIFATYCHMM